MIICEKKPLVLEIYIDSAVDLKGKRRLKKEKILGKEGFER
jgi:hypothetical protein